MADNGKKDLSLFYGVVGGAGYDTAGMTPTEVIEKYKELTAGELKEDLQQELPEEKPIAKDAEKKMTPAEKKRKTQDEFFGEEFKGVKGMEAVEKLLKEKRGHVKNAFERPEIGGIDLVWGDEAGGLLHVMKKRDKLLSKGKGHISGIEMAKSIPFIIEKGTFNQDGGRMNIDYNGFRVGLIPQYFDQKVTWIVTAMELWT